MFDPIPSTDHVSLAYDTDNPKSASYFDDITDRADRWTDE